ncbi:MAG: hypothetical protein OFPII_16770 [Osedax symbiont Rs1]|nr:MAG: hypothetical protein OFPII_16770 [Osedax symbiont Rs1]
MITPQKNEKITENKYSIENISIYYGYYLPVTFKKKGVFK